MVDNILCPICQRPNDSNAERCWYCHAELACKEKQEETNTDWLNNLRDDSTQTPEPEQQESTPEKTGENQEKVPDWLARIRELEQMEREAQLNGNPEPASVEKQEELPDWLIEIKAGNSGKSSEHALEADSSDENTSSPLYEDKTRQTSPPKKEDDIEEWLNHLAAWKPMDSSEPLKSDEYSSDENNESAEQVSQEIGPSLVTRDETEPKPDGLDASAGWQSLIFEEESTPLSSLENGLDNNSQQGIDRPVDSISEPQTTVVDKNALDLDSLRGNLGSQIESGNEMLGSSSDQGVSFDETEITEAENSQDRLLEWEKPQDQVQPVADSELVFIHENADNNPFIQDDLPDWLSSTSSDIPTKKSPEEITEEVNLNETDSEIEKASLPAWLQAARPSMKDTTSKSGGEAIEKTGEVGLLAGIADPLQKTEISGDFRKPVGYGSALKVSERQKNNANLFASLVDDSFEFPDANEPKTDKVKNILWRFLLAAILICIAVIPKEVFSSYTIQPVLYPPEVVAVYDLVNTLPVDRPVLLSADFELAVSGEISWSSQVLLEHMMRRDLNFVIFSTNPTSSVILMEQMHETSQKITDYDLDAHVIDLGFLPGGSTGLQLTTENLRTAFPNTYTYQAAWNTTILQPINTLSDFGAVLAFSDKAESARSWVEQIQPELGKTPILFVVSAQAAPMIQPYFQSGQITGFIAGLPGSLAYEQIYQHPANASIHLAAFQVSTLFVAVLLLLGGLVNLLRPMDLREKDNR